MFVPSGTIGNDPPVLFERNACQIHFNLAKGDGYRAGNVPGIKCLGSAHVYKDGCSAFQRSPGFLDRHARHVRVGGG